MDNQTIRRAKLKQCKALSEDQRKRSSQSIVRACQSFIREQEVIGLFMPLSYEPDITSLYDDNHKYHRFALPKVTSKTAMDFVEWTETTAFQTGAFDITEPINANRIDPKRLTLLFIPLVAFNHRCERLGHGNGYYDRYLKQTDALKIGVAFSVQQDEELQSFAHDIALDIIITEQACFYKEKQGRAYECFEENHLLQSQ